MRIGFSEVINSIDLIDSIGQYSDSMFFDELLHDLHNGLMSETCGRTIIGDTFEGI